MKSIVSTLFFITSKVGRLSQAMFESCQSAIFMGILDESRFVASRSYPIKACALDIEERIRWGNDLWMRQWIEALPGTSRVLVIGAGGGSEIFALAEAGHEVVALEYDREIRQLLRSLDRSQTCGNIEFADSAWLELPENIEPVDAVLFGHCYLSHIPAKQDRKLLFERIKRVVKSDAFLGLAFYHRESSRIRRALIEIQFPLAVFLRTLFHRSEEYPVSIEKGNHLDPLVPMLHHHFTELEILEELASASVEVGETGMDWFGWASGRFILPQEKQVKSQKVLQPAN